MEKRTQSMELRAIREGLEERPPPAPQGTSVREWFAGLALANPALMKDVPARERAEEAVRLADELISALSPARVPSQESMQAPSEQELNDWSQKISEKAAVQRRPTPREGKQRAQRPHKRATLPSLPPPPLVSSAKVALKKQAFPASTQYSSLENVDLEE